MLQDHGPRAIGEAGFHRRPAVSLADYPNVHKVIPTTTAATLLVLYSGPEDPDDWAQTLRELVMGQRVKATGRPLSRCTESWGGHDPAA